MLEKLIYRIISQKKSLKALQAKLKSVIKKRKKIFLRPPKMIHSQTMIHLQMMTHLHQSNPEIYLSESVLKQVSKKELAMLLLKQVKPQ